MDASRLTRLRREQATQFLATHKVRDASETTNAIKYRNSKTYVQSVSTIGNAVPCDIKTAESMSGSFQQTSADSLLFKTAGYATCCSEANNTKGLVLTLPSQCYTAEANPVLTTKCTPTYVGVRRVNGALGTGCCDSNVPRRFPY
jgi:hypothetical protein